MLRKYSNNAKNCRSHKEKRGNILGRLLQVVKIGDSVKQACTTYGPRKLLILPAKPKIMCFMDIFLLNVLLKG